MNDDARGHAAHGGHLGHVVPLQLLVAVLGALLVLTFVTVAVTWVDLGSLNIVIALAVAVVKASLVLLYFMHLRWDRPFNAVVLITSLALVACFIGFALIDTFQYHSDTIPGYAPNVPR